MLLQDPAASRPSEDSSAEQPSGSASASGATAEASQEATLEATPDRLTEAMVARLLVMTQPHLVAEPNFAVQSQDAVPASPNEAQLLNESMFHIERGLQLSVRPQLGWTCCEHGSMAAAAVSGGCLLRMRLCVCQHAWGCVLLCYALCMCAFTPTSAVTLSHGLAVGAGR